MKIITIVGARPQFVKAAVVSRIIGTTPGLSEILVHTGQHYDSRMSRIFFDELGIPAPDYNLGIGSLCHGAQTGRMLEAIENVLLKVEPDWVLVYGDTNSTLAGALAASKLHVPVAHVEAGLRSYNQRMPEETNRVLTDHVAELLFAPTGISQRNLCLEGIPESRIRVVGDVMYDAALYYRLKAEKDSTILSRLGLEEKPYILATIHRAENTDDPVRLQNIISGLNAVAGSIPVVWPVHPRTVAALKQGMPVQNPHPDLRLIEPVGYLDMISMESAASLIVTDSGGVQKEAFFLSVPCVTLRDETEWIELLELGWNSLVSPSSPPEAICLAIRQKIGVTGKQGNPFGDGRAAEKIVLMLEKGAAS